MFGCSLVLTPARVGSLEGGLEGLWQTPPGCWHRGVFSAEQCQPAVSFLSLSLWRLDVCPVGHFFSFVYTFPLTLMRVQMFLFSVRSVSGNSHHTRTHTHTFAETFWDPCPLGLLHSFCWDLWDPASSRPVAQLSPQDFSLGFFSKFQFLFLDLCYLLFTPFVCWSISSSPFLWAVQMFHGALGDDSLRQPSVPGHT